MNSGLMVRMELTDIFLDDAKNRAQKAKKASEDMCQKVKIKKPVHQELWGETTNSIHAIMLSVFALESYINMIGHDRLDQEVWEELKLLKLENKWILFPKLISGKTFNKEDQLFKDFIDIIKQRNYLVHYKDYTPKEFVSHSSGILVAEFHKKVNSENAILACTTAEKMIEQIQIFLGKPIVEK